MGPPDVIIATFMPSDAEAFAALNRAWLVSHGLLEPADEKQLYHPREHILAHGGEIFVARARDQVVGCCAAIPRSNGSIEVAKLAVDAAAQGSGIGRRLVNAALAFGVERGFTKAILTSNHRLRAALNLYESIGFRYAPVPADVPYESVDVYMELDLATVSGAERLDGIHPRGPAGG